MAKKKIFDAALHELGNPMPPISADPRSVGRTLEEAQIERSQLERQKLIMLLMHYDLEWLDYRGLSLALAREYIDGFKEPGVVGRKKKWNNFVLCILFVEIIRERESRGLEKNNDRKVYHDVSAREPWKSFLDTVEGIGIASDPAEAIRRAYFKAKKNKGRFIVEKAFRWHQETDTVDEWEELVMSIQASSNSE